MVSQTPDAIHGRQWRKEQKCTHHWIIPEPNGPETVGRCKLCGGKRTFFNSEEAQRGAGPQSWRTVWKRKKRRLPTGFHEEKRP